MTIPQNPKIINRLLPMCPSLRKRAYNISDAACRLSDREYGRIRSRADDGGLISYGPDSLFRIRKPANAPLKSIRSRLLTSEISLLDFLVRPDAGRHVGGHDPA